MGGGFQASSGGSALRPKCGVGGFFPGLSTCKGRPDPIIPYLTFKSLSSLDSDPKTPLISSLLLQGTAQMLPHQPLGRNFYSLSLLHQCLPTLPAGFYRPPAHVGHAEQSLCSQSPTHSQQCVASGREQLGHHQKLPAQISDG